MQITDIPLFALADRKLAWVDRRQAVLAANVANIDTPGYRARDVAPFDAAPFEAMLGRAALQPVATAPGHMAGTVPTMRAVAARRDERAPDGNAVRLDQQMTQLADTDDAHALVSGLYRGWLGMFRTAIGH